MGRRCRRPVAERGVPADPFVRTERREKVNGGRAVPSRGGDAAVAYTYWPAGLTGPTVEN
jgi:hypothetical protein